jgi:hypothetical protein
MTKMEVISMTELENILQIRVQSALERFQGAQDEIMQRYYKGQVDTLKVVLRDIENVKFEMGVEGELPLELAQQAKVAGQKATGEQAAEEAAEESEKKPGRKKRKKAPKKAPQEEETYLYKDLAHEAIRKGVIRQNYSSFYHDLLPGKGVRGFVRLYTALENNEDLRQAIQAACKAPAEQAQPEPEPKPEPETDPHAQSEAQPNPADIVA